MLSLGVFVFSHVLFCKLAGSADRRNVRGKSDVRIAEGSNADLRHCIAGLRRRSRCFFWRLVTLRAVLWVFANACNKFGEAKRGSRELRPGCGCEFGFSYVQFI